MQAAVLLAELPEPGPGAIQETGPGRLAVFDDPEEWAELDPGSCELVDFVVPREL